MITLHNTLTGKKETFKPIQDGIVSMYQCGPTVYDRVHIGNLRTFVFDDIVRRVFEYEGFKVNQAMNITDVDDKTIRRSRENGVSLAGLTDKYERSFFADLVDLNILRPTAVLSARDSIAEMITLINTLLEKGIAYNADDGVYMHVDKVKEYGKLAGLQKEVLKEIVNGVANGSDVSAISPTAHAHSRIANDEYDKENPADFALWKFEHETDKDGTGANVSWDAPFGKGRPGWHIECSAMSIKALGPTFDIHTGGADLIFPHHTNEIAQSEAATDKPFVHYWLHGGMMNVNESKMSKSKGNFLNLNDLIDEHISPVSYRYWLLTSHYRSQVNFTLEAVRAAQTALFNICASVIEWRGGAAKADLAEPTEKVKIYFKEFESYITDDFNMPQAVALMWKMAKDTSLTSSEKYLIALNFDRVFGLGFDKLSYVEKEEIPLEIMALAEARQQARIEKDWQKADALRQEIEERGFIVSDTPDTESGFSLSAAS